MMSFKESVKMCLTRKYATMRGRASRAEYWWFQLFRLFVFLFCGLGALIADEISSPVGYIILLIGGIFILLTIIPNICVCVRRLHDRSHSGNLVWWAILLFPFGGVGGVFLSAVITIINIQPGEKGENAYGPNPVEEG